jgi:hypothetical protein
MLGVPKDRIVEVAGDDAAGFYRVAAAGHDDAGTARELEVYSWGGLTSGPASRALWLLFLPFILVNLAHWMLPPQNPRARAASFAGNLSVRVLRLIGLSLTVTLMLAMVLAVMDVTVWQCAGLDYCGEQLWPLSLLVDRPRGQQLALGAAPVGLAIAGILLIGRANPAVPQGRPPEPAVMRGAVPLADDTFWVGDLSVTRLRACHVIVWASGLAALTLFTPARYADSPHPLTVALLAANAVLFALALVCVTVNRVTGRGGAGADRLTRPLQIVQWVSVGVLVASLVWVSVVPASYPAAPTHLPALRGAVYLLLGAQVLLFVALFACTAFARATTTFAAGFVPTLRGFTAPFAALIALLVGGGFSTGVGLLTALLLGDPVSSTAAAHAAVSMRSATPDSTAAAPLIVPPPFFWAAIIFVGLLAVLLGVAVVVWLVVRRRANADAAVVLPEYTDDPTPEQAARAKAVASARAWASVTDVAIPIAAGMAVLTVTAAAVLLVVYVMLGFASLPAVLPALTKVSVMIIAAAAAALAALAIWALRDRKTRRVVGVLWDVATFWPRANHPLTPPCYAERIVPELLSRVSTLSAGENAVVLAAHSQGSIIAAAAVLQAAGTWSDRVAALTFGSPLRRLYARNFSAYFSSTALQQMRDQQHRRWINMWALTDPIGSWVFSTGTPEAALALEDVDYHIPDVTGLDRGSDGAYPPICGHSGFWTRPEYTTALNLLASQVLPGSSTLDQPPSPPPAADCM